MNRGDLVAEVHDLETIVVEIAVAEWETADVEADQQVRVRARAYPGLEFEGKVTAIAATVRPRDPAAAESGASGDRMMLVTTALDNGSLRLKPGMKGYAKISGGQRRILDLLTRRLSGFIRTEFWFW